MYMRTLIMHVPLIYYALVSPTFSLQISRMQPAVFSFLYSANYTTNAFVCVIWKNMSNSHI